MKSFGLSSKDALDKDNWRVTINRATSPQMSF